MGQVKYLTVQVWERESHMLGHHPPYGIDQRRDPVILHLAQG